MTSITTGHTRRIVLLSAAILLATSLAGCTPGAGELVNEKPFQTTASAPSPTAVPIGGILEKETALNLRREMSINGDFAYMMPDSTWVKTNRFQPLPAPVVADQQAKALDIPTEIGKDAAAGLAGQASATKYAGNFTFSTGKSLAFIVRIPQAAQGGATNALRWVIRGTYKTNDEFPSAVAAQQSAAAVIAARPDPLAWEIIVGN